LRQRCAAAMPRNRMACSRVFLALRPVRHLPLGVAVYPVICRQGA
jgi:hypothetical protein